jgi:hypothetical protein
MATLANIDNIASEPKEVDAYASANGRNGSGAPVHWRHSWTRKTLSMK